MLGLACSISSIEILQLNNVVTGYIMMIIYYLDTVCFTVGQHFWQSLANTLDLPILLLFPKNIASTTPVNDSRDHDSIGIGNSQTSVSTSDFALLDVADIVIPGIFLALMLRFDHAMQRKLNVYFYASLLGYVCGIVLAIAVLIVFRQMYTTTGFVVPCCLLPPAFVALRLGDLKTFFSYDDAIAIAVVAQRNSSSADASKVGGDGDNGDGNSRRADGSGSGEMMAAHRVSDGRSRRS